jgi:hypothetical protein
LLAAVNVPFAGAVICGAAGGALSIVKVIVVLAVFSAASVAATVTVCCPSASAGVVNGELHEFALPLSTLQVVEPAFVSITLK